MNNILSMGDHAQKTTKTNPLPAQQYLKECFDYDTKTGRLTWKTRPINHFKNKSAHKAWNANFSGKIAGTRSGSYLSVTVNRKRRLVHRVIYKLAYNVESDHIDHINSDPSDNRLTNLRAASRSQNFCNKGKLTTNTSGFKGVSWQIDRKKWGAFIQINKIQKRLGSFDTPEAAHAAYCQAANQFHGEFANYGEGAHE